jgi:hypothetical protein
MKKILYPTLLFIITTSISCGEKKDFCDCIKEAANSATNEMPKGCEYIKNMKDSEQTEKAMACMGEMFKEGLQNIEIESTPIEAIEEVEIDEEFFQ